MIVKLVILESPYAGDVEANVKYGREALLDSLMRGESPMASHMIYTQVLDDKDPLQRELGIEAGLAWLERADATVVYTDLGVSRGMQQGIERAERLGKPIILRKIRT